MAKQGNVGNKVKTQVVMKRPKGAKFELPVNTGQSSPRADLQVRALFAALLSISVLLFGGGTFWAACRLVEAARLHPVDWLTLALMTAALVTMLFVLRSLVWMSFFASIMLASKNGGWAAQEMLCRTAIGLGRVIPGAASTASLVLSQNLLGKSKAADAIALAEEHWRGTGSRCSADQNLALICATAGLAKQILGEMKESIVWNERSIDCFKQVFNQAAHPKGLLARLVSAQKSAWAGPLHMHQAAVYLHNANAYFSGMNHRQAKENYKRAVECANQAPDSAEKKEVLQVAREQLGRLKHA